MNQRNYGNTADGSPIDDQLIETVADEADQGHQPGQRQGRRRGPGRPPLGDAAKTVESVRLDPSLRDQAAQRAATDCTTVSEVMRRALRQYLHSA